MRLDRPLGNAETPRDRLVGQTLGKQRQNLPLPIAEGFDRWPYASADVRLRPGALDGNPGPRCPLRLDGKQAKQLRRQILTAGKDEPNRVQHDLRHTGLGVVTRGAGEAHWGRGGEWTSA